MIEHAVDIVIATAILVLALRVISDPNLFSSIVLFIAMGLMLALAWVRLNAPDIALAEAAIGAGITGALFIRAARGDFVGRAAVATSEVTRQVRERYGPSRWSLGVMALVATGVLGVALGATVLALPAEGEQAGLTGPALSALDDSGVDQPVTAVLLNYRAYDTWLEIGVLLLAAMGVLAIHRTYGFHGSMVEDQSMRVLAWLARAILPIAVLIAGYLYWSGTHSPGGAFQAGAILAAGLVLLALAGFAGVARLHNVWLATGLALSFAIFLGAGAAASFDGNFLSYRDGTAGLAIVGLELTIVISTAVTLAMLFTGAGALVRSGDGNDAEERLRTPPSRL